jgi:alpha-2-macroglobulin
MFTYRLPFAHFVLPALLIIATISCSSDTSEPGVQATEMAAYISSHTAGMVSTGSDIRVTLVNDPGLDVRELASQKLFSFEPSVRGEISWTDDRTVVFRPNSSLRSGTTYRVNFRLGDVAEVPEEHNLVGFTFNTIHQDLDVRVDAVSLSGEGDYVIRGAVLTADVAGVADVKRVLRAEVDGRELPVLWPESTDRRHHPFEVAGIGRTSADAMLRMRWNGSTIGVAASGVREMEIPGIRTVYADVDTRDL